MQVDVFGDWAKSTEWMRTSDEFKANPIGQFVDPDRIADEQSDGVAFEQIHAQAMTGAYAPRVSSLLDYEGELAILIGSCARRRSRWAGRSTLLPAALPGGLLKVGDRVRIEIEGIGALENTVVAEPDRFVVEAAEAELSWAS